MNNCMDCKNRVIRDGADEFIAEGVEDECKPDNVNHPAHYETGAYECFDVMVETQGVDAVKDFCICNAFKYLYRFRKKNGDEDVKKANWYLNKYLELCKE